jgi:hypothetical protein
MSFFFRSSKFTVSWSTIWSAGDAVVYEKSKDEVGNKILFNDLHIDRVRRPRNEARQQKFYISSYSRILMQLGFHFSVTDSFSTLSNDSNMQLIKKKFE